MIDDKKFDELLQTAIPEACYEEVCELEEQMLKERVHVFPEDYDNNMKSILMGKKVDSKQIARKEKKSRPKLKYLLVAVLLFILSSMTVFAYEPAREALKELLFSIYEEHILIHPQNDGEADNKASTEIALLKPSYIPAGCELIDESVDETLKDISIVWMDKNERILHYTQTSLETGGMVISSDGNIPKDIKIGEVSAKLITEKDGMNTIFYEEDGYLFVVSGFVEKENLIRMLLSLE